MTYCNRGKARRLFEEQKMGGFTYGGNFEKHINELYSPKNIHKTAKKFAEYEKKHGPYKFGQQYTKYLVPKTEHWKDGSGSTKGHANWEKNSGGIPVKIKNKLTRIIRANLRSKKPKPMHLKVGENVDATHDLHVKSFKHKGKEHIGLHVLCPNSSLKK
jgi:hypothetical protein